jgi:hypothetical protein
MRLNSLPSPKPCHLLTDIRGLCYSAFATPNLGITWTVVSLLGGLICLTYQQYKRRSFHKQVNMPQSGSENSYEWRRHEDDDSYRTSNVPLTPEMKEATLRMQNNIRNAPQEKKTLRLESIQEGRCESDRGAPKLSGD